MPLKVMADGNTTSEIAKLLSEALIGEVVPPPFGALIIGLIFPSGGLPSYFDQVYAEISKIVNQTVTANTIATIDGKVNGTRQYVRDTYTPLKSDPKTTAQQKFDAITPYVNDLYQNVVATLQEDLFAQPGFSVFLMGASVHLALLQEQAFVDPNHQGDPSSSPYATAVSNNARGYVSFATKNWADVMQARRNNIILDRPDYWNDALEQIPPGYPPIYYTCWRWKDTLTGGHGPNHVGVKEAPDQRQQALAEIPPQQNAVVAQLDSTLGGVETIIANWNTLIQTPLPGKK